jgi:sulfur relay (sulfurtransferase) DsrC/TusE family protein
MKIFACPQVVIFANFAPDKSNLSADRWEVIRLDREFPDHLKIGPMDQYVTKESD